MRRLAIVILPCIALFKAGIGAVEELKGLVEIGKKHIEKYEKEYRGTTCSERVCL